MAILSTGEKIGLGAVSFVGTAAVIGGSILIAKVSVAAGAALVAVGGLFLIAALVYGICRAHVAHRTFEEIFTLKEFKGLQLRQHSLDFLAQTLSRSLLTPNEREECVRQINVLFAAQGLPMKLTSHKEPEYQAPERSAKEEARLNAEIEATRALMAQFTATRRAEPGDYLNELMAGQPASASNK